MALSLSNFLIPLGLFLLGRVYSANIVTYDFNITWVSGKNVHNSSFVRDVIGINGQWPIPPIYVNVGDNVILNVFNGLGNETTSIHVHGIFQNGTTDMDGAAQVSQCPIPPGYSFTYNFTVNQPGTYWFHSHVSGQYPEGLRAPFIVHDPDSPFLDKYDEEVVLTFSDWYDDQAMVMLKSFISYKNPTGAEPIPDAALMNDTQNLQFDVQAGKTYFFRMVNIGAFAPQYIWFEGHSMTIIEIDGVYTVPQEVDMIYITPAQRYGVLITMLNDTSANYAIVGSMDTDLFDHIPPALNPNVTGWLVYNNSASLSAPQNISEFNPLDDSTLVAYDQEPLFEDPTYTAVMSFQMGNLGDGANYAFINGITYVSPKVPTLYTVLTSGSAANSVDIYGNNTNAFVLEKGDVVEIQLNNQDTGKHPFHLHGHNFQVLSRADENAGVYDPTNATETQFPAVPARRDTLLVQPLSYFVVRFRADNPGVWLFHCHIEWHTSSGLIAVFVEAPAALQASMSVPANHYGACAAQNIPTAGNAAGNTADLFDLDGENKAPAPLPAGFTARGIVALAFSCVSAFVGVAVISWYGSMPITTQPTGGVVSATDGEDAGDYTAPGARGDSVEEITDAPKTE